MSDTSTSQQLVVFSLGAEEYALPIAAVHEIIRFAEPRSVASEVPWIRGVIGLRGKIIPVYDLAARDEHSDQAVAVREAIGQVEMTVRAEIAAVDLPIE
jgi:purine-binding chemotaxis protein CheW